MSLNNDDPIKNFHTNLSVGDILRRARLKKGLAIEDLEIAIRVSAAHLVAIEEGRLEVLPGRVYALGFIRSYAEYVGLDGDKIIGLLKRQAGEKIAPKDIMPMQASMLEDYSLPTGKMFGLIFALLVCVLGARAMYSEHHYASNETIPSVPDDLKGQMTALPKAKPAEESAVATNPSSADEVATKEVANQIVLRAIENVWLEIRGANRKTLFSRVLAVGEEYWIPPDQAGLTMTLGNAGGLQILVDGQALPFLGKTGQVVRNVVLDHDKLRDRLKENLKNSPKPAM